jgi:hypothetical protein
MSLFLTEIENRDEIKDIVYECFSGDSDLIERYHIKSGSSLRDCAEDTFRVLKDETTEDFRFYKVTDHKGVLCGFIGVDLIESDINNLTTFCLKPGYRSEENKEELWQLIMEIFRGGGFVCALYSKNERAINYLLKRGCNLFNADTHNGHPVDVLYYLKKEELCHS